MCGNSNASEILSVGSFARELGGFPWRSIASLGVECLTSSAVFLDRMTTSITDQPKDGDICTVEYPHEAVLSL